MRVLLSLVIVIYLTLESFSQDVITQDQYQPRERFLMDSGWRFALGHAFDAAKDFGHATGYFSYFTKTGYGDGPAAANFNDSSWRKLDLPHDWCVELPFSPKGGYSHGYKAIGRNFPENSIGWYRKKFFIPEQDLGRRISIEFDGVHRNSSVWINGFYVGNEHSGYTSFSCDITDYLNYGGINVVAVRADAMMEEGWYYEGAGIYRHVWLTKTDQLHTARYGTFVTTDIKNDGAEITVRTTVVNESDKPAVFEIEEIITDAGGRTAAKGKAENLSLLPLSSKVFYSKYMITGPSLWSLEDPYLHRLTTIIRSGGKTADIDETNFGIRTVRFDPDEGFFLNGKRVIIKGTNVHQDHAGVGTAVPDALWEFRVKRLKEMGSNAIRTSHNPPAPELLDACDRLGMLVMDENRLMGSSEEHLSCLEQMMKRDRNHPSVVIWSMGNEEWAIESNIKGARIGKTMQDFAQKLDSSRAFTAAISGGWEGGTGRVMQVMGYNYIVQGNIDEHHKAFPWQAGIGTEESNTIGTRGVYVTNDTLAHLAPRNRMPENVGTESGWKFYAARPFLAGLFYWTGFDYRGEATPYEWPAVTSQFGILDLCGFPKDIFYYLKSWWTSEPVLYIMPHWNWKGREGKDIKVTVYSNCEQIELLLNDRSLGRQDMPVNGHLEWNVKYQPGTLMARGFKGNKEIITEKRVTAGSPSLIRLSADKAVIKADGEDVSVITVMAADDKGNNAPEACNDISFELSGHGKIIGVGNGNPSSHETERFTDPESRWKRRLFNGLAQVIVQSENQAGEIILTASSSGMKKAEIKIQARPAEVRASVKTE